jgi:hypothetical protein
MKTNKLNNSVIIAMLALPFSLKHLSINASIIGLAKMW